MVFEDLSSLLRFFYPQVIWRIKTSEKKLFLTFDDGPIPEVTEFVLDTLKKYQAKATFFCVGENITKHPIVYNRIQEEGHAVGNHTYNHLKGWQTPNEVYYENIEKASTWLVPLATGRKPLFRPPYGRITPRQSNFLTNRYTIIMWDVLTCDYKRNLKPEACLARAIRLTKNGSIIVFHDSTKSFKNMSYSLPRYLEYYSNLGYQFETLTNYV